MDDRLERIENKLDRVDEKLGQINITLVRQTEQLAEHMRRTEAVEAHVDLVAAQVAPLTKAHLMWMGVGKALAALGAILAAAEVVMHLLHG